MIKVSRIAGGMVEGEREFEPTLPVQWHAYERASMWGYMLVEDGDAQVNLKIARDGRVCGVMISGLRVLEEWPEVGEGMLAEGLPVVETRWDGERHDLQRTVKQRQLVMARRGNSLGVFWADTGYLSCIASAEKVKFLVSGRELAGVIFDDMTDDEWMMFDELELKGGL